MKKLFTICVFAFAFLIGTQNSFAQVKQVDASTQSSIKEDVKNISNTLGLNDAQTDALAEAYIKRSKLYESEKSAMTEEVKKKIDQQFYARLEGTLTKEQIARIKSMKKL